MRSRTRFSTSPTEDGSDLSPGRDEQGRFAAETQGIAAAMRAARERLESVAGSLAELEAALLGERRPGPVEGEAPISTAIYGLR